MARTAYEISPASKAQILDHFPPKYPDVFADHITVAFAVPESTPLPPETDNIDIVGYADDGKGIEALVVSINGATKFDGRPYHLTLSCDKSKMAPAEFDPNKPSRQKSLPYKPANSIALIEKRGYTEMSVPFKITATPKLYGDQPPKPKAAQTGSMTAPAPSI